MKGAKISGGIDGLERFQKALRDAEKMRVKVGILGAKNGRMGKSGELTNAEVGQRMEFGGLFYWGYWRTVTGRMEIHIPPRSFLRMPLTDLMANLPDAFTDTAVALLRKYRVEDVFKRLGVVAVAAITKAFTTKGNGTWAPNHPLVIKRKGSDSPLIDTGQLRRSIAFEVMSKK